MKARLEKFEEDVHDTLLTFRVSTRDLTAIPEGDLSLTIKKWRNPRSRDALNYSWQIVTDIANALQEDKENVYKRLVNDFGEFERDEHNQLQKLLLKAVVDPLSVDLYLHRTEHTTEIEGTLYRLYWVVKPPHEYNTQEFARFIDSLIREAREIGVEVDYTR